MRRRRTVAWKPVLVALLVVNLAVASFRSGLTAIRTINLDGVRKTERLRLERVQAAVQGKPAMQVNPAEIEQIFLGQSRVKSADFRRGIFGSARLTLVYRQAVAKLADKIFLDSEGKIFDDPEIDPVVPPLILAPGLKVTVASIVGVTDYRSIATACELIGRDFPTASVEILETGSLLANIDGGKVVFGRPKDMGSKVETLKGLLRDRPELLKRVKELNLMVPDQPSVRPLKNDQPIQPNP